MLYRGIILKNVAIVHCYHITHYRRALVTAAHCLEEEEDGWPISASNFTVVVGSLATANPSHVLEPHEHRLDVTGFFPHPNRDRSTISNDIAIVTFSKGI